jgi:hypothetical protein
MRFQCSLTSHGILTTACKEIGHDVRSSNVSRVFPDQSRVVSRVTPSSVVTQGLSDQTDRTRRARPWLNDYDGEVRGEENTKVQADFEDVD